MGAFNGIGYRDELPRTLRADEADVTTLLSELGADQRQTLARLFLSLDELADHKAVALETAGRSASTYAKEAWDSEAEGIRKGSNFLANYLGAIAGVSTFAESDPNQLKLF